ncbi:hypothetical protein [Flavobacterium sp.]|uniref:hypothetical protein n=1 Tax=Flavobacterium sp. TaxID=239 RepID=UPI0033400965
MEKEQQQFTTQSFFNSVKYQQTLFQHLKLKYKMKSNILNQSNKKSDIQQMSEFYEWLLKVKNVYLHDNNKIDKAFQRVTQ